jgi:hypothetical protein
MADMAYMTDSIDAFASRPASSFQPSYNQGSPTRSPQRKSDQTMWPTPTKKAGPVAYEPNSAFAPFNGHHKITHHGAKERNIQVEDVRKSHIPGYTGYVRGMQHVSGRTYGSSTKRALDSSHRDIACSSPIPSSPQANTKVRHATPNDTFISGQFKDKSYHVPGYTGFVPGARHTYSKTYGTNTSENLALHNDQFPATRAINAEGNGHMAATMRPRQQRVIDMSPLPGPQLVPAVPNKTVPKHLRHLKFYS